MENDILIKLQEVEIEILESVHNICKKNGIKYYLIAGSLLGAVRHKGFIPWDDDIDIAMPRADYNKFIDLCHQGALGNDYMLHNISTDSKYYLSFAKIRKLNTLFDEKDIQNIDCNKGIFIDVFPLDYSKDNSGLIYNLKAKLIKDLTHIVFIRILGGKTVSIFNRVLYVITKPFTTKFIMKVRDKIASFTKKGKYYINYSSWYNYKKETIPVEYYGDPIFVEFADKKFFAPNSPELVLSQIFGDYMKLPPEEERKNHNPTRIIFDLKNENMR